MANTGKFTPPSGREHPPGGKVIGGQHGHGKRVAKQPPVPKAPK